MSQLKNIHSRNSNGGFDGIDYYYHCKVILTFGFLWVGGPRLVVYILWKASAIGFFNEG